MLCAPKRSLLALLPVLAACATPSPTPDLEVYGAWTIAQARSEPLLDRSRARLVFGRDGALSGHGSCNTLRASFTLDGDRIRISPVVTTRLACAPGAMEQEDRVLSALEATATARVRPDGLLELRDADGRGVLRALRPTVTP